ncbi:MAG: ATP-dependent RecD-like DNA helicase [bacterium]|nr:ATP-dependent RecD-like DNA helicase [bacterium]
MKLSSDQKTALDHILEWYKKDKDEMQFITLGGYAGTGKTTLIAFLRKELDKINPKLKVGFASYTGKAARVLRSKLKEKSVIKSQDSVGTIHSLIYSPIVNDKEEIIGWKTKEKIDRNLIIIDEGSMVDGKIWNHLLSYKIPIIVVGDHGQLPPINGNFYLMQKPILILSEIHRQAKKNPIISLSIQARNKGEIDVGIYSELVKKIVMNDADSQETVNELLRNYTNDTLILCGYNKTRLRLNSFIRNALGLESPYPISGDRVICLRNNHKAQIFNGMLGTILSIEKQDDDWYLAEIEMDGEDNNFKGLISVKQFNNDLSLNFTNKRSQIMKGDLFDFGYALTVHKAQGSQAKRVILFEERFKQMDNDQWKRWLYTAVTRAEKELYIFSSH